MDALVIVVIVVIILLGTLMLWLWFRGRNTSTSTVNVRAGDTSTTNININPDRTLTSNSDLQSNMSLTRGGLLNWRDDIYLSNVQLCGGYSPEVVNEYLYTSKPIPDIGSFLIGGANILSRAIRGAREVIAAENDVKFDIISLMCPTKLLIDIEQKVIMKYVGGMRNLYSLQLFGHLQSTTEIECLIDSADDKKVKGTQAGIMDRIILIRIHSKLMKIISENTTMTDIFIKGYIHTRIEETKMMYNPIVMLEKAELTFEALKDMSAADCTDVYRFATKLVIMTAIAFYKHKRPACIEWFKSITDKECFAIESAMSVKNPKPPLGRVAEGTWTFIDMNILLREFIPFLLETVSDDDIKFVVDIILMKPKSAKEIIKSAGGTTLIVKGVKYALAAAQVVKFTVDMLRPKRIVDLEDVSSYASFVASIDKLISAGVDINAPQPSTYSFGEYIKDVSTVVKDKSELIKAAFDKLGTNVKSLGSDVWKASKELTNNAVTKTKDTLSNELAIFKRNPKKWFEYTLARAKYAKDYTIYATKKNTNELFDKAKAKQAEVILKIMNKYDEAERALRYAKDYAEFKAWSTKNSILTSLERDGLKESMNNALRLAHEAAKPALNEIADVGNELGQLGIVVGTKVYQDTKSRIFNLFGDVKMQYEDGKLILRNATGDIIRICEHAVKHVEQTVNEEVATVGTVVTLATETVNPVFDKGLSEEELAELVNASLKNGEDIPGFVDVPPEEVAEANANELNAIAKMNEQENTLKSDVNTEASVDTNVNSNIETNVTGGLHINEDIFEFFDAYCTLMNADDED